MCPKRELISLYHDQEVPSPWKGKMEDHLSSCPECRAVLAEYGQLGEYLGAAPEQAVTAARERVWDKLTAPEFLSSNIEERRIISRTKTRNWNITMPVPVAAAAVLVIIASLTLVGINTVSQSAAQNFMASTVPAAIEASTITETIAVDDQGIVPVANISEIIQYLSNQGLGEFMIIRLPPESPNFSRTGEPVLINAANYQPRRSGPRW